ncbi:hypothetical protein [Olivibacter jilunii]|uniref:hypothetical protein n=1 Tax=Olivibacter jilunii TaxID=985016 RepID=UPI003F17091E
MQPKLPVTYGGMLTQDELAERYVYISARVRCNYTEEELSFLLGRAPYYFSDYERMEEGAKLTGIDMENLKYIFSDIYLDELSFEKDEFYAYNEKRIVRVRKECEKDKLIYRIFHPWIQRKNKRKVNEPLVLHELYHNITVLEKQEIKEYMLYMLRLLLRRRFFNMPRAPYCIYREVDKQKPSGTTIYPIYLKQALYDLTHKGLFSMKRMNGVLFFSSSP